MSTDSKPLTEIRNLIALLIILGAGYVVYQHVKGETDRNDAAAQYEAEHPDHIFDENVAREAARLRAEPVVDPNRRVRPANEPHL